MVHEQQADILVADDERSIRWVLKEALTSDGHRVHEAKTGAEALAQLNNGNVDLALLDIRMPEMNGLDVVTKAQEQGCGATLVVMTAQTTMANAVEAMKRGAYDYVTKPFDLDVVRMLVRRALEARELSSRVDDLRGELRKKYEVGVEIVGRSPAMQNIYKLLGRVAQSDATVLIQGESGTGKELIAKALHYHSPRWEGPFVAINCSAIPRELLESELFGYERGAFTGAEKLKKGKFEMANGGTIFLDEVGNMSSPIQSKVLRVLQEREVDRVGGERPIPVDVRVVAATNASLEEMIEKGTFREDLFYRLNVITITLPPLRERREDIPLLVDRFIQRYNRETKKDVRGMSRKALDILLRYRFPGNVRELENIVERAVVLEDEELIQPERLPFTDAGAELASAGGEGSGEFPTLEEMEKRHVAAALRRSKGVKTEACRLLGISRPTLDRKIHRYRIEF